jgi:hypothetical protein
MLDSTIQCAKLDAQTETTSEKESIMILFNVKSTTQLSDGLGGFLPASELTTEIADKAIDFAAHIASHSNQGQCIINMIDTASIEGSSTHKTFQGTMTAQKITLVYFPSEDLLNAVRKSVRSEDLGTITKADQLDDWAVTGHSLIH